MHDVIYWLDDFTEETNPCTPTLEGWAEWLAAPDPELDEGFIEQGLVPAKDGATFGGTRVDIHKVEASYHAGAWTHDRPPVVDAAWYVPMGDGGGYWDADDMRETFDDVLAAEVSDGLGGDRQLTIACLVTTRVQFRLDVASNGSRLTIIGDAE